MLVERNYAATVDVRDPVDVCAHADAHIMQFLTRRFTGRNWGGGQIVRVLGIVRRSDCCIKETDLSAEGYFEVEFRALVMVLGQWDIVTGVKIVRLGQLIVGRSQTEGTVIVNLAATPEAETVRIDQTVAVRIRLVKFAPDQAQATALGLLLTCDRAAPAYAVDADLSREDARDLDPLVAQIQDLLAARAALMETRQSDVLFFETILYSYACRTHGSSTQTIASPGAPDWKGPGWAPTPPADGVEVVNLLALHAEAVQKGLARTRGLVWCRDLIFYRSSPLAAAAPQGSVPARWSWGAAASPRTAFAEMLKTVYSFLKAINEMVAVYNTAEMVEAHSNIWLIMRSAQLPAEERGGAAPPLPDVRAYKPPPPPPAEDVEDEEGGPPPVDEEEEGGPPAVDEEEEEGGPPPVVEEEEEGGPPAVEEEEEGGPPAVDEEEEGGPPAVDEEKEGGPPPVDEEGAPAGCC
jgi:hypothetical protein